MNDQLIELYKKKFESLAPALKEYNETVNHEQKATNPLLIKIPENYFEYKNRMMIFGQETRNWCNECEKTRDGVFSNNIEKSIEIYKEFYLNGGINEYRGSFWNEFKQIKKSILESKDAIIIWNNINKIGNTGKGNVDAINQIQFDHFDVIRDELKVLKPDIVIFFTGHAYDFFIEKNIGLFNQVEIQENLYELTFENNLGVKKCYKTFHPQALYRKGINRKVMPELIKRVKNACI